MNNYLILSLVLILGGCSNERTISNAKESTINTQELPLITRYIMGKADKNYFDAETRVAKRWNINLVHKMGGLMGQKKSSERLLIEKETIKSNAYYTKKFGNDWQKKFKKEVLAEKVK